MNKYTDQQRDAVLTLLQENGGNVSAAVRETGINRSTIRHWWGQHRAVDAGIAMVTTERKPVEGIAERWLRVQNLSLDKLHELLPTATIKELQTVANTAGISADKYMDLTQGRKGTQVNVNNDLRRLIVEGPRGS